MNQSFTFDARKLASAALAFSSLFLLLPSAVASPTDIIADNSVLRDDLSRLAIDGVVAADASSFLLDREWTTGQAARLLETGLGLSGSTMSASVKSGDVAAVRSALALLRPELVADKVDVDAILKSLSTGEMSYIGMGEAEERIDTGGHNNPGSGEYGIYRGTVVGDAGQYAQYGLSVSNQSEDNRRLFTNDEGPHDFSALSQAYLQLNGARGFNFLVGRTDDNWGPSEAGGTLLSDNAPPLDQLRISFPFSFGKHLGRNWLYTQLASTYDENNTRIYFQARRIELDINRQWSAQYEEGLKSTSSKMLVRAPLPFGIAKAIDLSDSNTIAEYIANLGLQYQPSQSFRAYGELLINDVKSPFRGHVLGLDLGNGTNTPQRVAYVLGVSGKLAEGTSGTFEYSISDPTTYTDSNPELNWTKGAYDYLGLPGGPDFKQFFAELSQQITPKVTLSIAGRSRDRFSSSYPSPTSQDVAASARYQFDRKNSVSLTYHDYYQDAYPIAPGAANYPTGDGYIPVSNSNPGFSTKIQEIDAAYVLVF